MSKVESGVVFWKLQVRPQSQVMPFYSKIILAYGIKGVVRLFVPSLFFFFKKKSIDVLKNFAMVEYLLTSAKNTFSVLFY